MGKERIVEGLSGKQVLITGGCGDIGRAVARRFLDHGCRVALADLKAPQEPAQPDQFPGVEYFQCDVTSKASVESAVARLGRVDIAICNAGVVKPAAVLEIEETDWQRTLAVNLTGSFLVAQAAAKLMLRNERGTHGRRGSILFTGSWVQQMPWPECAAYCASKGGQEMLMKVLAQELASEGILCNIVAPGLVYAGLTRDIYDRDPAFRGRVDRTVPLGRMGEPVDIARAILFLSSEESSYVTGHVLSVNGGYYL